MNLTSPMNSYAATLKSGSRLKAKALALGVISGASLVWCGAPASAASITFDLFSNPTESNPTALSFTSGGLTLTIKDPVPTTANVQSNVNGTCVFTGVTTAQWCGQNSTTTLTGLTFDFSAPVKISSYQIKGVTTGTVSPYTATANFISTITSASGGTFSNTQSVAPANQGSLASAINVAVNGAAGVASSYSFSTVDNTDPSQPASYRMYSITVEYPVATTPGPLPLVGAAAAFAYSRNLRKRLGKVAVL